LDDAARPELADLCLRLGCRYLSRTDGRHAKAGNLNHALPHLRGDLLLVFDADVVPQRHFLSRTVGLFDDPRVALVQTPQSYMNPDPVSRNLGLERWLMPDEEVFYRWIEPTRQGVGAVVCAGTSFLVRPSALEQVGGFEPAPLPRTWRRGSGSLRLAIASSISTRNSAPAWLHPAWWQWRVSAAAGRAARSRRCEPRRILWSSQASTPFSGWPF
ncbi:MAG: glycosyltransferase, partial [Cyanobium sp.]